MRIIFRMKFRSAAPCLVDTISSAFHCSTTTSGSLKTRYILPIGIYALILWMHHHLLLKIRWWFFSFLYLNSLHTLHDSFSFNRFHVFIFQSSRTRFFFIRLWIKWWTQHVASSIFTWRHRKRCEQKWLWYVQTDEWKLLSKHHQFCVSCLQQLNFPA